MVLNEEQRQALRNVIKAKLTLWDVSLVSERVVGHDLDTASESLDSVCAGLDTHDDVDELTDEQLLEAFDIS